MLRPIIFAILVSLAVNPTFAQLTVSNNPSEKKPEQIQQTAEEKEAAEKLQKLAIEFLRETASDVSNLRTAENRISFTAELASLMWFHDEREAKVILGGVFSDFRELLSRIDAQANAIPEDDPEGFDRSSLLVSYSDKMKVDRKLSTAIAVRQQITTSIAEHDPELALNFYYDSYSALTNPGLLKMMEGRDSYFEIGLLTQIAEKSAAKAVQLASRSLEKGFGYQHISLLKKLYEKDPEMGIEFGRKIKNRIASADGKSQSDAVIDLIEFGIANSESVRETPGKKALYSASDLREMAEPVAARMLSASELSAVHTALAFADSIEKVLPSRATQIRAKYGNTPDGAAFMASRNAVRYGNVSSNSFRVVGSGPVATGAYGSANANSMANPSPDPRQLAEERLQKNLKELGNVSLPKEEREKVIAEARKILMTTNAKDKKIMGLSMIAAQVARIGDKDLANEIMRDAAAVVNPSPKNYQEFILIWMLASGYAESDPDQAFPIIEDAIGRANGVINAFVTVGEFIDAPGEMIADGEIQIGAFGGGMIRGLSRDVGIAENTIKTLIKADFDRTKGLSNRFDRHEARVLAKMLILRAALGKKPENAVSVDMPF